MNLRPFAFMKLGAVLLAFALFSACENKREDIRELTTRKIGVEKAKDVQILYTIGELTEARIQAPIMLRHVTSKPYIEFPAGIQVDFFNDSLEVESKLRAEYARYTESESKVFLRDSVVVYNLTGDTLYSKELYWDRHREGHEFYTDKPVRIRTPTHLINGEGLDAPQDFSSWHVINGTGIVRVPESELTD